LHFVHQAGATGELHVPEIMGAGTALFDYDQDGDLDIYLTNGALNLGGAPAPGTPVNHLFRQEPDGRFVDVTVSSGLGDPGYGMGVAVGDIDNDGDLDVYVTNYGPDRLYRNRGDGTFQDVTAGAGIDVDGWSCSAAFFDFDRDGFLDLYVTRYVQYDSEIKCLDQTGRRDYCGPVSYEGTSDVLLHNSGDGSFTDVSEAAGMTEISARGLGVVCEDFNDDGWPDVYVANDAHPNQLWINRGNGTFRDEGFLMGAALNAHGNSEASMGVVAADFDNDADLDLFLTHLVKESNTLYRNLGGGLGFEDATGVTGHGVSSMPYTGFGTAAFDVEFDGDLDLAVVNGRVMHGVPLSVQGVDPPWALYAEPNLFYVNDGTGRFELASVVAGSFHERTEVTRGLAVGDVDSDGDLDLLIGNVQGPARLYRNDAPRKGHWLTIRAIDPRLHRDAIGAVVTVHCGDRRFLRTVSMGFSYLSSSDPRLCFGLGPATRIDRIHIHWPDGLQEEFHTEGVDRALELRRGTGEPDA
jgi:hypothetical protein